MAKSKNWRKKGTRYVDLLNQKPQKGLNKSQQEESLKVQNSIRDQGPFTPEKKAEEELHKEALLGILSDMAIMGASLATKNKKLGQAISRSYSSYKYYSNKNRAAKYASRYGPESTYRYPSPNRYSRGRPTSKRYDGYQVPTGQRRRRRY